MFQFPGFASNPYFIQGLIPSFDNLKFQNPQLASPVSNFKYVEGGFPHSEIYGSTAVRTFP